jgi:hypothetical protein
MTQAEELVDTYFPNLTGNPRSRHFLRLFIEDAAELPQETRDALTAVVKSRLNGTSAEVLGSRYEGADMLPGQPVRLTPGEPETSVQKPH